MPADRKIWLGQTGYIKLSSDASGHTLGLYDDNDNLLDSDTDSIPATGDYLDCTFCYSRNVLSATVTGGGVSLCVDVAVTAVAGSVDTIYCYLGGDSGATFDNFAFYKTYSTDEPTDGGCDTCPDCPPPDCTDCCTDPQPSGAYVVDLGAGGWSTMRCVSVLGGDPGCPDGHEVCTFCDSVLGEFVVLATTACTWVYGEDLVCTEPWFCCVFAGNPHFRFRVVLTLEQGLNELCRWKVQVLMVAMEFDPTFAGFDCHKCDGATSPQLTGAKTVTYYSDWITEGTRCQDVPVTLTKDSETGDFPCEGTLPATITLEAA